MNFIERVQWFEASISIGASTARGMRGGTVAAGRKFLRHLNLRKLPTEERAFQRHLEAKTNELSDELPCKSWGAARKFLNIFLRGALYNRFLCKEFGLVSLERFLEVPLDKSVANGLRAEKGGECLPAFHTIIRLAREESAQYQEFALQVAKEKRCKRVHLDLWYWRNDESDG
jgi:hypothetical protein